MSTTLPLGLAIAGKKVRYYFCHRMIQPKYPLGASYSIVTGSTSSRDTSYAVTHNISPPAADDDLSLPEKEGDYWNKSSSYIYLPAQLMLSD